MTEIKTKPPSTRIRSLQIATLVAELRRAADLLAASIKQEELLSRVSDPMDCHYPTTARSLKKRRENISATIASLETQLREAA